MDPYPDNQPEQPPHQQQSNQSPTVATDPSVQAPSSQPIPPARPQEIAQNPGQTFGILGIVFSFLFAPIGFVFSIVSTIQSSKASAPKTLGIIGIILSTLFMIILLGVLVLLGIAYRFYLHREQTSFNQTAAKTVQRKAETYRTLFDSYPATINDFARDDATRLNPDMIITDTNPTDDSSVKYQQCSPDGAQVTYYDSAERSLVVVPLGIAPSGTDCKEIPTATTTDLLQ